MKLNSTLETNACIFCGTPTPLKVLTHVGVLSYVCADCIFKNSILSNKQND